MLELEDIQHYLLARPNAVIAQYNFITFHDTQAARKWVEALIPTVGNAASVLAASPTDMRWVSLAFTWNGLRKLGLDEAETRKVLEENVYAKEVLADQKHAYEIGVQGVPFFVFNNKYAVSGAQQPETFAQVLEKVWDEEKPALVVEQGEGFCTIDGQCN